MTPLEQIILDFNKWSQPWKFYDHVIKSDQLSTHDRARFIKIWNEAGEFKLWNYSELKAGADSASKYIRENYRLSENAIGSIVNALAYDWK